MGNQLLHDRVTTGILEAAARVLSERGDGAGMGEVASEAGVSRATLYRYFPRREDLLRALVQAALDDAHQRLEDADLDAVAVPEALARMSRALVASAARFAVLFVDHAYLDPTETQARVGAFAYALFNRGVADGTLRDDLPADVLGEMFGGLLRAGIRMTSQGGVGVERAAAVITSVFLDGARV
jgi:TetR/AcrR family transcriptional regulator, mexCD-oprJ operon repressor